MADLYHISGQKVVVGEDQREPDLHIIDVAQKVLRMAENGELMSLSISGEMYGGDVIRGSVLTSDASLFTLIGLLDSVKLDLLDEVENGG